MGLIGAVLAAGAVAFAALRSETHGQQAPAETVVVISNLAADSAEPPAPVNEDRLAASFLLRLDDLPAGWSEEPGTHFDPAAACPVDTSPGGTGRAQGTTFAQGSSFAASSAAVYDTPENARNDAGRHVATNYCLFHRINRGEADTAELQFSNPKLGEFELPGLGDWARGTYLYYDVTSRTGGYEATWNDDTLYVVKGRYAAIIRTRTEGEPIGRKLLEALAHAIVDRMPAE